jgi:hypothetical protein
LRSGRLDAVIDAGSIPRICARSSAPIIAVSPRRAEIESALERAEHPVALIEASALSPRILELRGHLAGAAGSSTNELPTVRSL